MLAKYRSKRLLREETVMIDKALYTALLAKGIKIEKYSVSDVTIGLETENGERCELTLAVITQPGRKPVTAVTFEQK